MNFKVKKNIEDYFTNLIKLKYKSGNLADSPITILKDRHKLGDHIYQLMGIVPEILCGAILDKTKKESISFKPPTGVASLRDRKGLLICHALSPYSESLGFYCDLGRAFRIAKGLTLNVEVMLAKSDWSEYNWVVKDLGLKDNLFSSSTWRESVYEKLGFKCKMCGLENAITKVSDYSLEELKIDAAKLSDEKIQRELSKKSIIKFAKNYVSLVQTIWGRSINSEIFTTERKDELLAHDGIFTQLRNISLLQATIEPIWETLRCVIKNFHRVDLSTFTYFILQYYHQSYFKDYLKVSMHRESDFDESFRKIVTKQNYFSTNEDDRSDNHINLAGLYFDDYNYGIGDSEDVLTAHPYYFPSGSIYTLYKGDLQKAVDVCIMITDFKPASVNKIERILLRAETFERSRILADLLSFSHLLSSRFPSVRKRIAEWLRNKNNLFIKSWDKYAGINSLDNFEKNCKNWSELIFTNWVEEENPIIPYHFLPYFWEDLGKDSISVKQQAELVNIILSEAHKHLDVPEIIIDPISSE